MKKKHIIFISIIVVIILFGNIMYAFKNNKASTSNKSGPVAVYKIPAKDKIFVNGIIVPEKTENIYRDETKGSINKVSASDGQLVKKGALLFTYKNELITDQIEQANQLITTSNNQKNKLIDKQSDAKKLLAKQKEEEKQEVAKQAGAPSASVDSNSIVASLTANTEALISSYPDQIDVVQTQIDTSL